MKSIVTGKHREITKGVRVIKRPRNVQVYLQYIDHTRSKSLLSVIHADGNTELLPISNRVADVLIARGMS